jgi:hypothetical protein
MSNVLIGIVGVILFIGLALAGATFFGPITSDSIAQAKANTIIEALGSTATAVHTRERELEVGTTASASADFLVPDFMSEAPRNAISGSPVALTSSSGSTSSGQARYVVTGLGVNRQAVDVCRFVNAAAGNGDAPGDVSALVADRSAGCGTRATSIGPYGPGEYVAFQKIS